MQKASVRKTWLRALALTLAAALILPLTACSNPAANADVLSQRPDERGKTRVSVLVKYAFSINAFEKAVEKRFPELDLVQVGNYTRDMGIDEYSARLEHDDLTDIVMAWPLDVGREYWDERLLDLSGMDFTSRYNLSMLNSIAQDGKLYYLPGPAQVRGIVYNKTLFEEKGWQVPADFEGFVALCKEIEASGLRSIQLGFGNSEVLDTAFIGYNFAKYFSRTQDTQWLSDYDAGTGSFGDHFDGALDVFQLMVDEGIWKPEDLNITYSTRETMFFTRQCAMVEDSVLMARMGESQTGTTDEFALMPFFNPSGGEDWARLYMVCYIGLNKQLADPANKKKYELVLQIMDYISTPEGQEALSADTGAMFSSLMSVDPPDISEIQDLQTCLRAGRYAVFPQLKNAQSALREGLSGMVRGELTKQDVISMVDQQNLSPSASAPPEVLGQASTNFTLTETGNFVTDVMRAASGCDVALFMDNGKDGRYNGKGISASLYAGDVTTLDLWRVLPDLKQDETGTLWITTMTGEDLLYTLEHAIPIGNNQTGWFYYFSGLHMTYDPTAEPGQRVKKLTLADGTALEPQQTYTVAVMDDSVPADRLQTCEKTDVTIHSLLSQAVRDADTIAPSGDGRFLLP